MRRFLYILVPAIVLASLIAWRIVQNKQQQAAQTKAAQARKKAPPLVRVAPVVERDIVHAFQGIANVQAPISVQASFKVTGRLIYLQVREGARVTRGEVIARLDPSEVQAAISQQQAAITSAQANLNNAQIYYRRIYSLYKQGFIAAQDVDNARTQVAVSRGSLNAAVAQLRNLQYQLQDLVLRSPVNGYVTARYYDPGSVVSAGQAIINLQAMRNVFVTTSAPEDLLGAIQTGMTAQASFDAMPGRVFHGRVTHVDPAVDPTSREFLIEATFANAQNIIHPGMYGTLTVITHVTHNALVVPHEAIHNGRNGPTVTVVQPEGKQLRAQVVPVRTGDQDAAGIAITQGVQPGEQVVVLSAQPVRSGQVVRIDKGGGMPLDLAGQPNVEAGVGGSASSATARSSGGAPAPTYGGPTGAGGLTTSSTPTTGGGTTATSSTGTAGTATSGSAGGAIPSVTPQTYNGAPNAGQGAAPGSTGIGSTTGPAAPGTGIGGPTGAGGSGVGGVGGASGVGTGSALGGASPAVGGTSSGSAGH